MKRFLIYFFALAAVFLLLLADVYKPGGGIENGLREIFLNMDHPAALDRHPQVDSLYTTGFLAIFTASILMLYTVPARVGLIARRFDYKHSLLRQLSIGLAGNLVLIGLIVLSVFTPYTFPLAIISVLILFGAIFLGSISILLRLAGDFFRWAGWETSSPLLRIGYGLLIFISLCTLPYLGIALRILLWLLGSGVSFVNKFGSGKKWTLRPLVEELKQ
ncbi:MAG: hypothetical protein JXA25_01085 [Anaerolineales bacterium]|nr:hypothetical protein [Anaerolineales bacterium]